MSTFPELHHYSYPISQPYEQNLVFWKKQAGHFSYIELPYRHPQLHITYRDLPQHKHAQLIATQQSLDPRQPVGVVIANEQGTLSVAANGSEYHLLHGCERERLKIPTGQGYDLCEGCHPKNHAEAKAIQRALQAGARDLSNSRVYLHGHWWCCESCSNVMVQAGIREVSLSREWTKQHLGLE